MFNPGNALLNPAINMHASNAVGLLADASSAGSLQTRDSGEAGTASSPPAQLKPASSEAMDMQEALRVVSRHYDKRKVQFSYGASRPPQPVQ